MLKFVKSFVAAAAIAGAALTTGGIAQAQTEPASSLSELLDRIRSDSRDTTAEARRREAEFQSRQAEQQRLYDEALAELEALRAEGEELTAQLDANEVRIDQLSDELREAQGEFGELFGVARQAAGEVAALVDNSIVSAQFPGRTALLTQITSTSTLPTRRELDEIWTTLLHEMVNQRYVTTFTGRVGNIGDGGTTQETDVIRVGSFALFAPGGGLRFIDYDGARGENLAPMAVLSRDPASAIMAAARDVANSDAGDVVGAPIDPSRGELLSLVVDTPNIRERINQGGPVGYLTIGILISGVAFGLFRLVTLLMAGAAVRGQVRRSSASRGNALGRIMLAADEARGSDIETFELKLDQAIIRESSGLDFGLNLLKLAAGIAPLLGLLGTVVGMIQTFQQITLFGAGDPKIMAGGISTALMTTVIGLVAAIPLLIVHSLTSSASRAVQEVLEEQAAGIVAEHAARRGGA